MHVDNLRVRRGRVEALRGVNLRIDDGEMVGVVGPNGSGKSTLVRTIAGLLRSSAGDVRIDGAGVSDLSHRERAAKLGFIAQSAVVPELMTVDEHIGLGRHARRRWLARWTADDREAVERAMRVCEVSHLRGRKLDELSGGERQRVRLATLLVQDPPMLVLDEPLTGLDIEHQLSILELLRSLNKDEGRTVLCVLHDLNLALRFLDRVVVIKEGLIAADGAPADVLCPRIFSSVFGVDGRVGCEFGGEPVVMCQLRASTLNANSESTENPRVQVRILRSAPRQGTLSGP